MTFQATTEGSDVRHSNLFDHSLNYSKLYWRILILKYAVDDECRPSPGFNRRRLIVSNKTVYNDVEEENQHQESHHHQCPDDPIFVLGSIQKAKKKKVRGTGESILAISQFIPEKQLCGTKRKPIFLTFTLCFKNGSLTTIGGQRQV